MAAQRGLLFEREPTLRPTARPMLVLVVLVAHALVGWGLLQARTERSAPALVVPVFLSLLAQPAPARTEQAPPEQQTRPKAASSLKPRPVDAPAAPVPTPLAVSSTIPAPAPVRGPTFEPAPPTPQIAQMAGEAPPVAAPSPSAPAPATPRAVAPTAVHYLVQPEPAYPSTSRRLGEAGEVHLRVEIDTDGRARHVSVRRSSGFPRLDDSAIAAVPAARFAPSIENAMALAIWTIVPIELQLAS